MNLYWKKLFGKLKSTARFEREMRQLMEKFIRYERVASSKELEEYQELYEIVKSAEFKEKKKLLLYRKYKDTEEYRVSKKFKKLSDNKSLMFYLEHKEDKDLKEFLEFKKTPEYELLGNRKEVKKSEELKRFKAIEKSKVYKNYVRFHESFILDEYVKLQQQVSTPEFQKNNEFWANKCRWETTEDYQTEQRFFRVADNPDIVFYNEIEPSIFDEIRNLELTFIDDFDGTTLNSKKWESGFRYKTDSLKKEFHSFDNEKQANNEGANTTIDEALQISTIKETKNAPAWNLKRGFIDKTFHFTSDVVHAKTFAQKGGVFSAKIRCTGKLHHAFWLSGENKNNHINVFHFNGKRIVVGNATAGQLEEEQIKGICRKKYYIYSLEWTEKELIWYVNNLEVFRTENNIPQEELFMTFNSFILEKEKGRTGRFSIDWVKIYKRK